MGVWRKTGASLGTALVLILSSVSGAAADDSDSGSVAQASCDTTLRIPGGGMIGVVPANTGSGSNCILGVGNQGSAVRALQDHLRICNSQPVSTDGIYGPQTKAAVEMVQRRYGATVDGVYGSQTRNAMLWFGRNGCGPWSRLGIR
ncbi:peptidoglycan-binding domain-containing protein [Actinoalloteichus hoggarensis]|uniref:Autolytic lysozyme n=1 Tax=Actinoalloteichus hoggarensis TaxID=1470176 RepID=A0A221W5E4_9PSEU|nr:peptidoglycan-binding domain-containing protein [Actinoalloteichus hoggarensis]ASO20896.1 Autolytic lysozyme [Actinoalloteichus hoggarensis]